MTDLRSLLAAALSEAYPARLLPDTPDVMAEAIAEHQPLLDRLDALEKVAADASMDFHYFALAHGPTTPRHAPGEWERCQNPICADRRSVLSGASEAAPSSSTSTWASGDPSGSPSDESASGDALAALDTEDTPPVERPSPEFTSVDEPYPPSPWHEEDTP